jgi:subtilisin-like proprotein convertase family protein
MSLHPTDLSYMITGCQDNSSPSPRGNLAAWTNLYAGDGTWSDFDQTTPGIHFSGSQNGSVWRYTTATDTSPDYISPNAAWTGGFVAPAVFAGTGGSQIYLAGKDLLRWSTARTWTTVKTGLTTGGNNYATTIGKSTMSTSVMYTGSTDGVIWRTLDNAATWKRIDDANIDRAVGDIAVSHTSTTDILVGLQGTGANHLWRCTNTSAATPVFTNVSGNLPNTPINAVCFDPYNAGRWYVGTDIGVFMTSNSGASYTNLNYLGLPNIHVNALRLSKSKAYLYAATFGRGIWRIQMTSAPAPFSISGTVRTVGNAAFAGVTVSLKKWREYSLTYTKTQSQQIPDNNTTGITQTLPITLNYPLTGGTLNVNITHPFRGDVEITLIAPDGTERLVQGTSGDSGDNIVANYDFDKLASGLNISGTWSLRVRDLGASDVGTLNSWKVIPKFFTYVTQSSTTTNASGNYTFPGLDAGKYYVIPSFTGKTWTPAYRIMNVGPSRTLQDFKANQ